jgi:hypothetical protein
LRRSILETRQVFKRNSLAPAGLPQQQEAAMSMHTAAELHRKHQRQVRCQQQVDSVLAALRKGDRLGLHSQNNRALWSLASGSFVPPDAAANVTADPRVAVVDCGLPMVGRPQTSRCAGE